MSSQELGLSFRSEPRTIEVIRDTASRHGMNTEFIGVYDDLGDRPLIFPLIEAATHLPKGAETRLGAVGFAVPKFSTMHDIAGSMAYLSELTGDPNRVLAGLVPGAWMDRIGLKAAKVDRMRDAVGSLQHLLEHRADGYLSQYFPVSEGFQLNHGEAVHIPVLLGAWGEKMCALAGEVADEVKVGGSVNPMMVPIIRERIRKGADIAGRDPEDVMIALGAVTIVDEDGKRARELAKRKAAVYIDVIGANDPTAVADFPQEIAEIKEAMSHGDIESAVRHMPRALMERFILAGTPDEVIRHTQRIFDAGADE